MQNFLVGNFPSLDSFIPQATDLFMSGLQWLRVVSEKKHEIRFSTWAKLVRDARGNAKDLTIVQLEWLWEAITSEPRIRSLLGKRVISLSDEWRKNKPVECAPEKARFGIFLKNFRSYGAPALSFLSEIKPDAEAVILGPLLMKPGKARRLECCDVATSLEIRPANLGTKNAEAAAMKVEVDELTIDKDCIHVNVKSLNHAYTKTSLRLELHRRSHGGRAYDHVALKTDEGYIPLENIRKEQEEQLLNRQINDN